MKWGLPNVVELRLHAEAYPAHGARRGPGPHRRRLDLGGLWLVRAAGSARLCRVAHGGLDGTGRLYCVGSLTWGHRHPLVVLEARPLTADGEDAPWPTNT